MAAHTDEIVLAEDDVLVTSTDKAGRISFANDSFLRISGYDESELIGRPHNTIRHPDMPKAAFADLWDTIKGGHSWSGLVKNRAKDGRFYWVQANVAPVTVDGTISGYISVR